MQIVESFSIAGKKLIKNIGKKEIREKYFTAFLPNKHMLVYNTYVSVSIYRLYTSIAPCHAAAQHWHSLHEIRSCHMRILLGYYYWFVCVMSRVSCSGLFAPCFGWLILPLFYTKKWKFCSWVMWKGNTKQLGGYLFGNGFAVEMAILRLIFLPRKFNLAEWIWNLHCWWITLAKRNSIVCTIIDRFCCKFFASSTKMDILVCGDVEINPGRPSINRSSNHNRRQAAPRCRHVQCEKPVAKNHKRCVCTEWFYTRREYPRYSKIVSSSIPKAWVRPKCIGSFLPFHMHKIIYHYRTTKVWRLPVIKWSYGRYISWSIE